MMIGTYQASRKCGKRREGKADDWWRNRIMTEDGKVICCLGFIREFFFHGNPIPGYLFKRVSILKEWLPHSR